MSVEYSSESVTPTERTSPFARPFIWAIYLYRITLSPMLSSPFGGGCRYYPTCSHYAEDALRKYGAWRGSIMAIKRVLRCHPWHEGGYDPVR